MKIFNNVILKKRNENCVGVYLKSYYENRDFVLAIIHNDLLIYFDEILEIIKNNVQKGNIFFYGIFENFDDVRGLK